MRTSDLFAALSLFLFLLLPSFVRGEMDSNGNSSAETNSANVSDYRGNRIDPTATHCWTDSECPRYWTCAGKLGQLRPDGECPLDYSCPSDPGDVREGTCYYKPVACSTDADCPPFANCLLNQNDTAGQCQPLLQSRRPAP